MPKHDEKVNSAIHSKRSNQENTEGYTYTLRKKRRDVPWQSKKGPDSEFTSGIMPMHDARHRGEKCVAESRTEHRTIRVHHKKKKSGKGKQQSTYTEQQRKCGMYKISHRDRSGIRLQECVNCNRSGPESLCGNMMWGDFGYHQGGYFESFVNEARGGPRTTSQGFCSCRGHSRSDWELARCSSEVERTNR